MASRILRDHRLLEPAYVQRLEAPAEPDGVRRVVAVTGVDHQLDVGPDRLTHGPRVPQTLVEPEADLELDRHEAVGRVALGFLGQKNSRSTCGSLRSWRTAGPMTEPLVLP